MSKSTEARNAFISLSNSTSTFIISRLVEADVPSHRIQQIVNTRELPKGPFRYAIRKALGRRGA